MAIEAVQQRRLGDAEGGFKITSFQAMAFMQYCRSVRSVVCGGNK